MRAIPETHGIIKRDFFTLGNVPNGYEKYLAMKASVWIAAVIDVADSACELTGPRGKHQIGRNLHASILHIVWQFRFFLQSGNAAADDQQQCASGDIANGKGSLAMYWAWLNSEIRVKPVILFA